MSHRNDNAALAERLGVPLRDPDDWGYSCTECGTYHPGRCTRLVEPTRSGIRDLIVSLEFDQFAHPDDRDERERLMSVRELAIEQLGEDTYQVKPQRTGQTSSDSVLPLYGDLTSHRAPWEQRSEFERIMEAGVEPFMNMLNGEQRVLIRMRYGAQMTMPEIGAALHVSKQAVDQRLRRVHETLRAAMAFAFVNDETPDDESEAP